MTGCSSDMILAQLLDEQLNEVDHSSIAEHVQTCVRCQERLKALTSQASRSFRLGVVRSIVERSFADHGSPALRCPSPGTLDQPF